MFAAWPRWLLGNGVGRRDGGDRTRPQQVACQGGLEVGLRRGAASHLKGLGISRRAAKAALLEALEDGRYFVNWKSAVATVKPSYVTVKVRQVFAQPLLVCQA